MTALLLVVLVGGLSYRARSIANQSGAQLAISRQVARQTEVLLSALTDAETGQRGYLLTSRESYLDPYRTAQADIVLALERLTSATASRPDQAARLNALRPMVAQKLEELAQTIELHRNRSQEKALALVLSDSGKNLMDQIRAECAEIKSVSYARLARQTKEVEAGTNEIAFAAIFGSLTIFLLLCISDFTIQRAIRSQRQLALDLKRSGDETRGARDWLQTTVASIGEGLIATDEEGVVLLVNPVAQELTGWTQQEAAGKRLKEVFRISDEETGNWLESPVMRAIREGRSIAADGHTALATRDGRRIPVDHSASPIRSGEGTISGAVLIVRDVTARRDAERAIVQSEAKFHQLADAMPQMVWMAQPDGFVDYYNERWYEFTGFERGAFGDMSWSKILHPEDLPRCVGVWTSSVRTKQPYRIEYRFWDRVEKCWRWHLGQALPTLDSNGGVVRWFGTCTDIDEEKNTERELRRANEDLSQFAFAANHDLQEPLRMIAIYSQMLVERYQGEQDSELCVQMITEGTDRMRKLLADLLTLTQVNGAESAHQSRPVNLNDVFEGVIANLQVAIGECGATVTRDELPVITGYENHFVLLLENLIGNGLKYRSEAVPHVHVTATHADGVWTLAVRDNGIGIAPEYHQQIFGVFKRLHGRQVPGTGIGLAICRRVAERYGGRIWVESALSEGTTFYCTLGAMRRAIV